MWSNRICRNYRIFKSNHEYENYLQTLHQKDAIILSKFRCRSHALPVTKGRFDANMPHTEMQCTLCQSSDLGDEFHYLFVCPFFHRERTLLLPQNIRRALKFPSVLLMEKLFNTRKIGVLKKLAKFAHLIMLEFCHKPQKEEYFLNSCSTSSTVRSQIRTRSGRLVKRPDRLMCK